MMNSIAFNISQIQSQISLFEAHYAREKGCVQCLAVSKEQPVSAILEAYQAGIRDFAESKVQSALQKMQALPKDIVWHFIGSVQSNKIAMIAKYFDWVHSLDDEKKAMLLNEKRLLMNMPVVNVCIQVNVSAEPSKSGVLIDAIQPFAEKVMALPALRLRGLMAILQKTQDKDLQRQQCQLLKNSFDRLKQAGFLIDTLSMGMSHDFESAIAKGATIVRIGEAIFGVRS